jgi:hypothetical protein
MKIGAPPETSSVHEYASECVRVLPQGVALLERLDDDLYSGTGSLPIRNGVGTHIRHCRDFYASFLAGAASGRIDYNCRGRDARVEHDRSFAITELKSIAAQLLDLRCESHESNVLVSPEEPFASPMAGAWCHSTIGRELQYLLSHTIHHYALIGLILRLQGFEPGEDFGVAPSTLKYWKDSSLHSGATRA